ncbi:PH domain-containing protein [Streptomyces sp. NBC_01465]|uniref:PH domain-containing protein n=1 Tax=Streptomyces sp. NBC_01465 TaxID=2903878 RepID=UPI002E3810E8|nr:PH domain-containing protein [Streptomyces sp. NBC_01465]
MSTEPQTTYADRIFRSSAALVGGVLLLALAVWLGGDAVLNGKGRAPWLALAALLCVIPLVIAFTLRPAVYANDNRIRIRNPFRTITLPWAAVEDVRASYSSEIYTSGGEKYQLWAIPVSLRSRKRATSRQARDAASDPYGRTSAVASARSARSSRGLDAETGRAQADQAVADLRGLAERNAARPEAQGAAAVRWAFEIIAPAAVGALLFVIVLAVG